MRVAEERLIHLLQIAAHRVRVAADRAALEGAGITAAQAGVLFAIAAKPGATQRDLALRLRQQESAITAMVSRLLAAGLVARRAMPEDRRAHALTLTPAGQAALESVQPALGALNARLQGALGDADIGALADALRAISKADLDEASR